MSFEVKESVGCHSRESGAQPMMEFLTAQEGLVLRFYRQLGEAEQLMIMRMLEALARRVASG